MNRIATKSLIVVLFLFILGCKEDTIDFVPLGTITGQVFQNNTGDPLEGVEMSTIPATSVIYTDSTGNFTFEKVAANDYRLRARLDNYQLENVSISVAGKSESVSTIFLTPEIGLLIGADAPTPADQSSNVSTDVELSWTNPNESTFELTYDLELYEGNSTTPFLTFMDLEDTVVTAQNLKFNTQYFWQVTTKNDIDELEYSKLWKFTTMSLPDNRILLTMPNENGNNEIYSSNTSGDLTRLTYTSREKFSPQFNGARTHIAFVGNVGIEQHIFIMTNEGRDIKKISTIPVASYHQQGQSFSWSPDGTNIIYCHYDKLYSIGLDGGSLTEIATAPADRHFRSCDWGESTNRILVETIGVSIYDGEIYIMDSDGANLTELVPDGAGIMENPSFSIDGINFIYTQDLSGNESLNGRQLDSHILMAPIATPTTTVDLSSSKSDGTNDLSPRVSTDGASIIFVNNSNDGSGINEILTVSISDPSNRVLLVENGDFPSWK